MSIWSFYFENGTKIEEYIFLDLATFKINHNETNEKQNKNHVKTYCNFPVILLQFWNSQNLSIYQ